MLRRVVFLAFILHASFGFAQSTDSIITDTVKYGRLTKFPLASVTYTNYSNSKFEGSTGDGEIRMQELRVSFQFAIKIKEK